MASQAPEFSPEIDESSLKHPEEHATVLPEVSPQEDSLGHVPEGRRFQPVRFAKSLGSKDAWLGDYDYLALFIPTIPYLTKNRDLPFYGVHDKLPYLLAIILGLQHALAMAGGIVTPPLLLGGAAGANLGDEALNYLVSGCLIWSGIGTAIQVARFRVFKTRYYYGTGIICVLGTSFAFVNVGLSYINAQYTAKDGLCSFDADGNKNPCPEAFGAMLGTACATGLFAVLMAFMPPKAIRKLFPPLITGTMLTLIGAALVASGIANWAGGQGTCYSDHTVLCTMGSRSYPWGSANFIGLGFSSFITIVLLEVFGSPFMKSASVFIGLLIGLIIGAACGYFDTETLRNAPNGNFLWTHTFPLSVQGQLVLPMLAAWMIVVAECIGNVTASSDVSRLPIEGAEFESRVQGGLLADTISATLAGLAMITPLTTFSQNAGVISITRNASRQAGFVCAGWLFLMGVIGKFVAIFVAMPSAVLGGFTTFLFGSVAVAGLRVLAYAQWNRRTRFIATCSFALGISSLVQGDWASYIFTYSGGNKALAGLIEAVVLVLEEPYLIAGIIAVSLNAILPQELDEELGPTEEQGRKAWNQHHVVEAA